ncbi:MAG: cell wall-binding repeat-containing protein [Firmicutes bacterium]|nr:cell wall-binding repeat-containing protein [Bacillota bacterium]
MIKRRPLLAMLLAFALIFTLMPTQVSAASTVTVGTAQELYNAFNAATDGTVIKLSADITYDPYADGNIVVTKDITLDFNGKKITFTETPFDIDKYGTLTLVNASFDCNSSLVYYNEGALNIRSTVNDGVYVDSYIVYENEKNGAITISNSNIVNCEYIAEYNYGGIDLNSVKISGDNGVYYNYGKCTMTNVNAKVSDSLVAYNYKDLVFNDVIVESEYYAFPVEDQYDDYYLTYGIPTCIINGGTFTGYDLNCCMFGYCEINGGAKFVSEYPFYMYSEDCPTNVVINDADFTVNGNNVFYVGSDAACLSIYGGTFLANDSSSADVINVYSIENTVILAGGTFTATGSGEVCDDEYSYSNFIVPEGYMTIPDDWWHTSTLTIIPPLYRYGGQNRYETAIKAADALKEELGLEKFDAVILACGTNYADALAGSYLARVKNAPILLVDNNSTSIALAQAYIKANLNPGGTIYMLGGPVVVPETAVAGLTGYTIKRLMGPDRYATNIAILEEAGLAGGDILVCSGIGFADSLSASATGKPILLVGASIMDSQKDFIQSLSGKAFFIIGGPGAVNPDIESYFSNLGTAMRIGGASRFETSTLIARYFFTSPDRAVLAYAMNFPDGLSGGPLAYAMGGPLILASNGHSAAAADYMNDANIRVGSVLGGPTLISDNEVRAIFKLAPSIMVIEK